MRILIYGAGVIGSLYAVKFSKVHHDVTVLARGKRLEDFQRYGLRYEENGRVSKANINVIHYLDDQDIYDFIFLTVRADQVKDALSQLQTNQSPTIVTMVNTVENQRAWEMICGKGRILPVFPGAGGGWEDGVLKAKLTPYLIQPTTFGELDGKRTERIDRLKSLFQSSHIPFQIVSDMHAWQISHLGLVVPLADAYYMSDNPKSIHQDKRLMRDAASQIKQNFQEISRRKMLSPRKFHLIRLCPIGVMASLLSYLYNSDFAKVFMFPHAMKAPEEMRQLHDMFYQYLEGDYKNGKV